MSEINTLIAENILRWKRLDGQLLRYQRPGVEAGAATKCPNFLERRDDQMLLRQEMSRRGSSLAISHTPANWETNEGKTCKATFHLAGRAFESTQPYEYWAVCLAALLATGCPPLDPDARPGIEA